jgi:DegV family protein with EDD domain
VKIRFVVDSGCDVPESYVQRHQMVVVPLYVNYGGNSYLDDGVGLDRERYYNEITNIHPLPQTSAPSVGLAKEMIHAAFEQADHIICVAVADGLSSSLNVMRLAAEGLPAERVTLWDSETLSMGCGWQAIIGAEVAEQTGGDLNTVLAAMKRTREEGMVYAALVNVEFLRRGGRVSWTQAAVGGLLRIRPIVRVKHGAVTAAAQLRSHRAWVNKVIELTRAEVPIGRIALLHTNNDADVAAVRDEIQDILPDEVLVVRASPAIGTHTGPYGIGMATVRETREN